MEQEHINSPDVYVFMHMQHLSYLSILMIGFEFNILVDAIFDTIFDTTFDTTFDSVFDIVYSLPFLSFIYVITYKKFLYVNIKWRMQTYITSYIKDHRLRTKKRQQLVATRRL
jgi:hypothetical protein